MVARTRSEDCAAEGHYNWIKSAHREKRVKKRANKPPDHSKRAFAAVHDKTASAMSASDVKLEVPAGAGASTADTMGVPGSFADLTLLNTKGIRVTVRNLT